MSQMNGYVIYRKIENTILALNDKLVLSENSTAASTAASKVKVTYTDQQPLILTMEEAIEKKSIFPKNADEIKVGDAEGSPFVS